MFLLLIFSYTFLNLIIAYITYSKLRPFYPGHNISIHDRFPEFNRKDSLSFHKLYLGLLFLVWPRLILTFLILTTLAIVLSINKHNTNLYPCKDAFYRLCIRIVIFLLGGIVPKWKRLTHECRAVYDKYLGIDYLDSTVQSKRFAGIVANHISFIDVFLYASKYTCSFIGKKTIEKIPIVNTIAKYTNTIFFDRIKESERFTTAEEILKRQQMVMNGDVRTPILVFPEGTVSMGRNILQFKRGAFMSCLPLKPFVELAEQNDDNTFALANGVLPLGFHLIHALSQLRINVTILDLPVVQPTKYMLEHFAHFGKEKWMVYREVTRRIMAEVAGLELSDKGFQEKLEYISMIKGKKVKNT